MKQNILILLVVNLCFFSCETKNATGVQERSQEKLANTPPLGWNSFDSYGVYLHEKAAFDNLIAFSEKLGPYGYEYFVIDAGWFGEFKLKEGSLYPAEKHAKKVKINEYGLLQPSDTYFPNGFKVLIDKCHEFGLKFGLHLMRGIPRLAYKHNTKVKGTNYFAKDIADTSSICIWNHQNYGVNMSKPGSQAFYNSLVNQLAEWGVDFIKYDDLVPFPKEVEAVTKAIAQCGRPIVLSLSPGDDVKEEALDFYKKGNMLRVTGDIWDNQEGIDKCFTAWKKWAGKEEPGFWIDMDMIPFGQLQMMSVKPDEVDSNMSKKEILELKKKGKLLNVELLAGKGWNRRSEFTKDQMYTFITMRALAASPLMLGGDLPSLDDFSLRLVTDEEILACNQNGVMANMIQDQDQIEIWKTNQKEKPNNAWIGLFNRSNVLKSVRITKELLAISDFSNYQIFDIWNNAPLKKHSLIEINPHGVVFIKILRE
ncbi:MAG: glycoside hydrolase family 27 protein [Cyclobacteriaceae bacterium]